MKREILTRLRIRFSGEGLCMTYGDRDAEAVVALCDELLATPAAEPTAGDARAIEDVEELLTSIVIGCGSYSIAASRADATLAEIEKRWEAAIAAEVEKIAAHGSSSPLFRRLVEIARLLLAEVRRLTAAIRASSPTGSPDGSPDGEGGRET